MIYHNAPTPPGAPGPERVNPIIYVTWFWTNKELVGHDGWLCLCHRPLVFDSLLSPKRRTPAFLRQLQRSTDNKPLTNKLC